MHARAARGGDLVDTADVVGVTVSPVSGLVTTEAGGTATFTARLTSQPSADVSFTLSSGSPGEGT